MVNRHGDAGRCSCVFIYITGVPPRSKLNNIDILLYARRFVQHLVTNFLKEAVVVFH